MCVSTLPSSYSPHAVPSVYELPIQDDTAYITNKQLSHLVFSAQTRSIEKNNMPSSPHTIPPYTRPLSSLDRRRAWFFLVIVPYISSKCESLYNRWMSGVGEDGFEEPIDLLAHRSALYKRFRSLFLTWYPYIHTGCNLLHFLLLLRYLFEHTIYYTPYLWLCRQVLRRVSLDDMVRTSLLFHTLYISMRYSIVLPLSM